MGYNVKRRQQREKLARTAIKEIHPALTKEVETLKAECKSLQKTIIILKRENNENEEKLKNLIDENEKLAKENKALQKKNTKMAVANNTKSNTKKTKKKQKTSKDA